MFYSQSLGEFRTLKEFIFFPQTSSDAGSVASNASTASGSEFQGYGTTAVFPRDATMTYFDADMPKKNMQQLQAKFRKSYRANGSSITAPLNANIYPKVANRNIAEGEVLFFFQCEYSMLLSPFLTSIVIKFI